MSFADGTPSRLPLAVALTRRNGSFNWDSPLAQQDSFMFNAVSYPTEDGRKIARKRPGSSWTQGYGSTLNSPNEGLIGVIQLDEPLSYGGGLLDAVAFGVNDAAGVLNVFMATEGVFASAPAATYSLPSYPSFPFPIPAGTVNLIKVARYDANTAVFAYSSINTIHVGTFTYATSTVAMTTISVTGVGAVTALECMDTYVLVAVNGGAGGVATVYNSAAGTPLTYTPSTDYFGIESGAVINFMACCGSLLAVGTTEGLYFYSDAANPTGSPFSLYVGATTPIKSVPYVLPFKADMGVLFIGAVQSSLGLYMVPNNSPSITKMSSDVFDTLLTATACGKGVSYFTLSCVSVWGRKQAVVAWLDQSPASAININYMMTDLADKSGTVGQFVAPVGTHGAAVSASPSLAISPFLPSYSTQEGFFVWFYDWATGHSFDTLSVSAASGFADSGSAFTTVLQTAPEDANSKQYKTFGRIELIGNQDTSAHAISVAYTDDDYQTWPATRTLDMSLARPLAYNFGASRRRAFQVVDTTTADLQLQALELLIDVGTG
jgi:hypothetical protein